MRTVSRPELGLDAGALAHEEGEGWVARLDVPVVLLHELPAGEPDRRHRRVREIHPRDRIRRERDGGGVGGFLAAALAGEDWQNRTRISFTLRDRVPRHAIAAGCSCSIRFLAAGCGGNARIRKPSRGTDWRWGSLDC